MGLTSCFVLPAKDSQTFRLVEKKMVRLWHVYLGSPVVQEETKDILCGAQSNGFCQWKARKRFLRLFYQRTSGRRTPLPFLIHVSNTWIYVISCVHLASSCPSGCLSCVAKSLTLVITHKFLYQIFFKPIMLVGTIDFYHFALLSVTSFSVELHRSMSFAPTPVFVSVQNVCHS